MKEKSFDNNLDENMSMIEDALADLFEAPLNIQTMDATIDQDEGTFEVTIKGDGYNEDVDDDDEVICDEDCEHCMYYDEDLDEDECAPCLGIPQIENIIFNPPATVILWADGTKTVVKAMEGQKFERYAGFAAAVMKKLFGSSSHAKKVMDQYTMNAPAESGEKKYEPKPDEPRPVTGFSKNLFSDNEKAKDQLALIGLLSVIEHELQKYSEEKKDEKSPE